MAGTISSLQQQKNNTERVSVFIDGEFAFGVSLDTAVRLAKGQFLSDADIAALQVGDEHDRGQTTGRRLVDGSWTIPGLWRPDEVRTRTGAEIPDGPMTKATCKILEIKPFVKA